MNFWIPHSHTHTCIYTHTHTHTHTHIHSHTHIHTHTHSHTHTLTYTHTHTLLSLSDTHTYTHTHTHILTHSSHSPIHIQRLSLTMPCQNYNQRMVTWRISRPPNLASVARTHATPYLAKQETLIWKPHTFNDIHSYSIYLLPSYHIILLYRDLNFKIFNEETIL